MTAKDVDLNLFRVFDMVMTGRSVSSAAQELGVTASAVSHALRRFRRVVGDELFTLGEHGMVPTDRALRMATSVREGLDRLSVALDAPTFVPAQSIRSFRIAATDYSAVTIVARLVGRLAAVAPRVNLRVFPLGRLDAVRLLDDGRIDLAMNWFDKVPERMRRLNVLMEEEAVVVRRDHPLTREKVTKQRLFAFPHIVVELTGTESQEVDGFTDERGVRRRTWIERLLIDMSDESLGLVARVAVTVPTYSAVPPMLHETDMIATLPRSLAVREARVGSLVILDLPYEPLRVPIDAIWHERADQDAGLQWLIGEMMVAVQPGGN